MTDPQLNLVLNVVQACFLAWLTAKYRSCDQSVRDLTNRLDATQHRSQEEHYGKDSVRPSG